MRTTKVHQERVIVIARERDDSDPQTDYFGQQELGRWILTPTSEQRDLLSLLLATARRFPTLRDLPWEEHREKWSMGRGYYIQAPLPSLAPDHSGQPRATWYIVRFALAAGERNTPPWPEEAEAVTPSILQEGGADAAVRHNEALNGVEVTFGAKPAEEVREALKGRGFRWSGRQRLWYARYTPERLAWAQQLAGGAS
jgi:hypothetical protein